MKSFFHKLFTGFFLLSLIVILISAFTFPVFAQAGDSPGAAPTPTDFSSLLSWLTTSGGAVMLLAWAASWYLERLAWWQKIQPENRSLIILLGALFLGLPSVWLQTRPDLVLLLNPYFKAAMAIISVWLVTQAAHKVDPAAH
jgi:hypothetical protein